MTGATPQRPHGAQDPPGRRTGCRTEDLSGCRVFTSRYGEEIIVRPSDPRDTPSLCAMYNTFAPKKSVQGVPAADDTQRQAWVLGLAQEPINIIATAASTDSEAASHLVGHACLLAMEPGVRAELLIMVHQDWRNRSIGSALLEAAIELAKRAQYQKIWLVVSVRNTRAIHIYQKCGFELSSKVDFDIEMERRLT
jgi:RimJ/RimL family protein N-acetyltransferase